MVAEPTSALTFGDLILEIAIKLGVAYYGAAGNEVAQVPTDVDELATCKRVVNNGIRMFIQDAPKNGWRWTRPTLSLQYWPNVAVDATVTATGVYTTLTTITASEATFYPSMEGKTITVTAVGDLTIDTYVSSTVVTVTGDHHWTGSKTFSITSDGNFTLPRTFGGQFIGDITFAASTNNPTSIDWTSEDEIRRLREIPSVTTGDPYLAAVRVHPTIRRRWELMLYPLPDAVDSVEFKHDLYFDELTTVTETHPAGYQFDEAVKAACFSAMERDVEDNMAGLTQYYRQVALPNAFNIDARSAPVRLGSMRHPRAADLRSFRALSKYPNVSFDE